MTPASSCTASSGQWCRSCWARSLCSWRCVPAPWLFAPRLSRRGSARTKCAKTSPPRPQIAAATRPKTPSRQTLTPSCHRRQGPCRCLQCRCDAAIENIKTEICFSWNSLPVDENRPAGGVDWRAEDATNSPLPSGVVCMIRNIKTGSEYKKRMMGNPPCCLQISAETSAALIWTRQTGSALTAGRCSVESSSYNQRFFCATVITKSYYNNYSAVIDGTMCQEQWVKHEDWHMELLTVALLISLWVPVAITVNK